MRWLLFALAVAKRSGWSGVEYFLQHLVWHIENAAVAIRPTTTPPKMKDFALTLDRSILNRTKDDAEFDVVDVVDVVEPSEDVL
jgi:hypothetical protein